MICGIEKPLEESFYKSKGHASGYENRCKKCHAKQSRERRHENYDKEAERKKSITRRKNGTTAKSYKIMTEKYPEKYRARYFLRNEVQAGRIIKGDCVVCGNKETHGHHDDYSKPLEVKWLCREHHMELHRNLKIQEDIINK